MNKKVTKSDTVSLCLRSGFAVFCYDTKFFLLQVELFKMVCLKQSHKGQGPSCIKVKSDSFQQQVKAKCLETINTSDNEGLARIEYSRDLIASNSVCHQCCSIEFRLGKYPDEDCYEPLANKRKTVSGQMFDMKREDDFLPAVNYLQENDE